MFARHPPTSTSSWLVQYCFTSTETVGLLGTEAQDGHLDFHAAPGLWGELCKLQRVYQV